MPAYRRLEVLKRKIASEEPSVSELMEGSPGSTKANGVAAPVPQSHLTLSTSEENGTKPSKAG